MAEPGKYKRKRWFDFALIDTWGSVLTTNAFRVYIAYCGYRNFKTDDAFPSIATLRQKLHIGTHQAQDAIEELVFYGILEPVEWENKKSKKYKINDMPEIVIEDNRYYVSNDGVLQPLLRWQRLNDSVNKEKEKRLKKLTDTRKSKATNRYHRSNVTTSATISQTVTTPVTVDDQIVTTSVTEVLKKEKEEEKNPPLTPPYRGEKENQDVTPYDSPNGSQPGDPLPPDSFATAFDQNNTEACYKVLAKLDETRIAILQKPSVYSQNRHIDRTLRRTVKAQGAEKLILILDYLKNARRTKVLDADGNPTEFTESVLTIDHICRKFSDLYTAAVAWKEAPKPKRTARIKLQA